MSTEKEVVLITGCSTGVGLESAVLFARMGYKVYATMRNLNKRNALDQRIDAETLDIQILELNVQNTVTIESTVKYIIDKSNKIDLLINNAGVGFAKNIEQASEEEMKWVMDVNYYGIVRVIKATLPYMREQQSGRVINISSVGGLVGQPFNEFYCAAKFAVEGFTESLASYITPAFNIQFSLVEPGGVTTEFMNSAVASTLQDGKMEQGAYQDIFNDYMRGSQKRSAESNAQVYQTGVEVAEVIYQVAIDKNPPLRVRTSFWAEDLCRLKTASDPDGLKINQKVRRDFLGE
ncbi:SDR family oxidoreductase [Halosquirtibacter xylanolyticus]|uniref:SDR family oxidoreductase n=1 Tax=Halosquirtibacter xylanolyticus TaxID=3374599 RepID=UPI00374A1880|nr:SDR family oxidoreductase [Prolixibacteraceae bacterium]